MSMATRVKWYLESRDVPYEVIHHGHTWTARDAARSARIPSGRMAKCVLLEDELGYVLAIVPSSCRIDFQAVGRLLERDLELASEEEIREVFPDCELGSIPAIGTPYNIPMLVDESLLRLPDLYFEAGDHEDLVHLDRSAFGRLTGDCRHGSISRRH